MLSYFILGGSRLKEIKNCNNFRELGGYSSIDGRVVVKDKLFRSGNLNNLNTEDWAYFQSLKIKDVIDFRSYEEKQEHPYALIDSCQYHDNVALHTKEGLENFYFFMLINKNSSKQEVLDASKFVREGYKQLPFQNKAFAKVFEIMQTSNDGILFHCSSGKDRTGVMAALILKLLDVEDTIIMKDYLLSNEKVRQQTLKHCEALGFTGEVKDALMYCCSVHKELLASSFIEILKRYKDFNEYFRKEFGLNDEKIQMLRNKYLMVK